MNKLNDSGQKAADAVTAVSGDPSPVQDELAAVNDRYESLKKKAKDREQELEKAVNEGAQLQDALGAIEVWVLVTLETVESWDIMSTDPDTAKKQLGETEVSKEVDILKIYRVRS